MLTFVGFLFTVLNFLLLSYYDYDFYASSDEHPEVPAVPHWVWGVAAFNIFLAYTLGKSAIESFLNPLYSILILFVSFNLHLNGWVFKFLCMVYEKCDYCLNNRR